MSKFGRISLVPNVEDLAEVSSSAVLRVPLDERSGFKKANNFKRNTIKQRHGMYVLHSQLSLYVFR